MQLQPLSLSHKNITGWHIQRFLLFNKINAIADSLFFPLAYFSVLVAFCTVFKKKKCEKDTNQFDWVKNVETSHSLIFYWLIDPVSIHKTPSPILREADRGRAVTHEYSSDLRQEMIYHPHWAHLTWLTAPGDSTQRRDPAHTLSQNKSCSIVALNVLFRNKGYK